MREKKRFRVTVQRSVVQEIEIEVEADDAASARDIALVLAPNRDFSGKENDAQYNTSVVYHLFDQPC